MREAHQKPVLLQKGSRGLRGRAASTRTRYGVSASTIGAARNTPRNVSVAETGPGGCMARVSRRPRSPCLLVAVAMVPSPDSAPRDRSLVCGRTEPQYAPPLPGVLCPGCSVSGAAVFGRTLALGVSAPRLIWVERSLWRPAIGLKSRSGTTECREGWRVRAVPEDGATGLLQGAALVRKSRYPRALAEKGLLPGAVRDAPEAE